MFYYTPEMRNKEIWLSQKTLDPRYELKTESAFAQTNGLIGVRASSGFPLLDQSRGLFVAGVFNRAYEGEVTELVNCPDVAGFHIVLGEQELTPDRIKPVSYERAVNLHSGELWIEHLFKTDETHKLKVRERRFASMADPHVYVQKVEIEAVQGCFDQVAFVTEQNAQMTNSGVSHFSKVDCLVYEKTMMHLTCYLADQTLSILSNCRMSGDNVPFFALKRRGITGKYRFSLTEGGTCIFEKYTHIETVSKPDQPDLTKQKEVLRNLAENGYEAAFEEHLGVFKARMEQAAIRIKGASLEEQAAVDFALYHILGMMPWDSTRTSIGSKGLTGEGYKGHVFWDTEMFLLPFFTYLFPKQARNLLEFRYKGLAGARNKAKQFGYRGAMYPWEVALTGEEETPRFAALNIHTGKANEVWSGLKEHHVTADIGYAIRQYLDLTQDHDFLKRYGYEMLFEIAQFWVSRAVRNEEKHCFEILDIIGPDEYTEHIDNNTYTNYMARYCVLLALSLADQAKEEVPELVSRLDLESKLEDWKAFAKGIVLAVPNEEGIIPQDDTFLSKKCLPNIEYYKKAQEKQKVLHDYSRDEVVNMQVLKQADTVMLLNLFPDLFPADIVKKNVLFYESRSLHDSSLSMCAHAQACAAIGEQDMAWDFFGQSLEIDLNENPYDTTDGIHSASLGGIWNCIVLGFAGVHFQDGVLCITPQLPKQWEEIRFCMTVQEARLEITVGKEKVCLKVQGEDRLQLPVRMHGKEYLLERELEICIG